MARVLVLALVLRVVCAVRRSLWLDEFHTLHHASAAGLGALLAGLREDNHPPLAFLLVRASRALFGDSELALRLPSILCGLGAIAFAARLARRLDATLARRFGPLLVAVSSLHVVVSAEARMYALGSLAVAGWLDALAGAMYGPPDAGPDDGRHAWRAALPVALWTAVGLHAHYFFLHFLAVTGGAALVLFALDRRARGGLRALLAGSAIGVALSAPWYLYGFRAQLLEHELGPGGRLHPWRSLPEAFLHLEFHNLSLAGAGPRIAFLAAGALLVPLVLGGLREVLRRGRSDPGFGVGLLLAAAGLGVPIWAAAAAWLAPRSGFNWVYLAPCTVPVAVLAAAWPRRSRFASVALATVAVAAFALSAVNALFAGETEDYRGAVTHVVAAARPEDAVLAVEPSPSLFAPALGWTWYAPRVAADLERPAPERVPLAEDHLPASPHALDGVEVAYLFERGLDPRAPVLRLLRARFAVEREISFGYALRVHRFSSPRPPAEARRWLGAPRSREG